MAVANTHSQWVNGNLVFYDKKYGAGWLDAVGPNVIKYIDDFVICPKSTAAAASLYLKEWVITHTSGAGGTSTETMVVPGNVKGGWLNLSPGSSENDGVEMQSESESFRVEANSPLYFGIRYKVDASSEADWLLGLVETDTTVMDGSSHGIYFKSIDGDNILYCCATKDGTTTKTLVASTGFAVDTVYVDEFLVTSTGSVEFWHNGTYVGQYTAGIPSTDLAVTLCFETGASNTSIDMFIDWIRCIQVLNARAT